MIASTMVRIWRMHQTPPTADTTQSVCDRGTIEAQRTAWPRAAMVGGRQRRADVRQAFGDIDVKSLMRFQGSHAPLGSVG